MRRHNETPGGAPPVGFVGFDMQSPKMAMENVAGYLTELDSAAAERASAGYACFRHYQPSFQPYGAAGAETQEQCRPAMQAVYAELAGRRDELTARSTPDRYAWALQSARVALQGEWIWAAFDERSSATAWLAEPRSMRRIGSGYDANQSELFFDPTRLTQEYDLVINFEETTPPRFLPRLR